jgi:hypothetical protein
MVNLQHPLRLCTVIWFGSLEFMSLSIEYDMVLLPPRHMVDAQEQPDFRPLPPRRTRWRRNNHNRTAGNATCPVDTLGLTNNADFLARDLTNVYIMPGVSVTTWGALASTLLAPPPMVWEAPTLLAPHTIGRVMPALLAPPPVGWQPPASSRQEMSAPSVARGGPLVFNPILFQPSFDTTAFTIMYVDLPFPSWCLEFEEEDNLGLGLDFSGLHDPEALLQFLFTCNELLSDGPDNYNTDEKAYDPTRECFHIWHKEHDEGNQLGMPREDNAPPPQTEEPREQGDAHTLPGVSHMAHLE